MNLYELGQRLKNERENQGYSLDDVYDRIKISPSSLEHIEQGEVDDLPHPVYAKGFIKHYAEFLGLDGDELSNEFARIMSMEEAGLDEHDAEAGREDFSSSPGGSSRKWTFFSVLASVLLLAVLGWLVYDVFVKPSLDSDVSSTGVEKSSEVTPKPETSQDRSDERGIRAGDETKASSQDAVDQGLSRESMSDESEVDTAALGVNGSAQETLASQAGTEEGQQSQAGQELGETNQSRALESTPRAEKQLQESAGEDAPGSESQPTAEAEEHVLEISSVEACWLSADVDNRSKDIYLRPGESITFRFDQALKIKLGNAGGVKLRFNGQQVPVDARSGDVKTLTFP